MNSLANRLRPGTWAEVIGQDVIVAALKDKTAAGLRPPILFHGPSGTGKTTMARIVGHVLGCEPDFNLIERNAADYNGIDDVRKVREMANYTPFGGGRRLIVFDECHGLSGPAQEALLMLVESAPAHQFYVFCTTCPDRLTPTLRGRCQEFQTQPLTAAGIQQLLSRAARLTGGQLPTQPVTDAIIRAAGGSARAALVKLEQVSGLDESTALDVLCPPDPGQPIDPADVVGLARRALATMPQDTVTAAIDRLKSPRLIELVAADLEAVGIVGETDLALALYLIGISRLLARPLAGIVQGASSAGKSHAIKTVGGLFPSEAVVAAHDITPEALYRQPRGSLVHRFITAGERRRGRSGKDNGCNKALRELVADGRLSKMLPCGLIEQPGPVAYIESTTLSADQIFGEDFNRAVTLVADESALQTARIIRADAQRRATGPAADGEPVRQVHWAMNRLIRPLPVVVPFADNLSRQFPTDRVEARRGWSFLLTAVEASALLHQFQRGRESGRVVAEGDDWRLAYRLFMPSIARLLNDLPPAAAQRIFDQRAKLPDPFTAADCERVLGGEFARRSIDGALAWLRARGHVEMLHGHRGKTPAVYHLDPSARLGDGSLRISLTPGPDYAGCFFPGLVAQTG